MNFSKINKLKASDLNCNIFSVYDYDGLSMQELLCQFFTKINECIDISNTSIDICEYLVNEGLKKEVADKLVTWLNDGSLQTIINESVLNIERITLDVKNYGAKGDGLTDDTQAIQGTINKAKVGDKVLIPSGTYLCNNIKIEKAIEIICHGTLKMSGDSGYLVKIGLESEDIEGFKGIFKLHKDKPNYNDDSTGIKLVNLVSADIKIDKCVNFTKGIVLEGNNSGCAYNDIHLGAIKNNKYGLTLNSTGDGWVNENKFFSGRFSWYVGNNDIEKTHIRITHEDQNNNIFFSPSLENSEGTFIYCEGRYNTFYSPRLEGNSTIAHYTNTSYSNQILYPYFSENMDTNKIINEGKFNVFYGRYTTDMDRTSLINVGIEAFTNPNSNPDIDVPFRCGNAGSSSSTAFAVCNASKVDKMTIDSNGNIVTSGGVTSSGDMSAPTGRFKAKTATTTALAVTNEDGSATLSVKGSGSTIGRINLNNNKSYLENFISNVSIITGSSNVPAGAPTNYAGTEILGNLVYNTTTNKLYIHVGSGEWKSVQFS